MAKERRDLRRAGWLPRYGFALAMIVLATAIRAALDPVYGTKSPYGLYMMAALLVAWLSGTGPGILVAVAGAVLGTFVYADEKVRTFQGSEAITIISYLLISMFGVLISASERRSLYAREDALDLAESRRRALEGEQQAKMDALQHAYESQRDSDRSRRDLARVLSGVSDGLLLLDRDMRILEINDAAASVSNVKREDALGRVFEEVWPASKELASSYRAALAKGQASRFDFQTSEGRWFDISAYPGPEGLAVFFQDVSDRFVSESRLRASEDRYRTLTHTLPSIVWSSLPDGTLEAYNDRWYEYTGILPGSTPDWGLGQIHPKDRSLFEAEWQRAQLTGEPFEAEYRIASRKGEFRWYSGRALPSRNEDGGIVRWVGVATDIQDRKQEGDTLERLVLERTKELAESNAELERFCYSVAHDLRAPLRAIMSASMIVMEDYGESLPADAQHELRRQARAARQLGNLIDDLLELSRIGRTEVDQHSIDLAQMARSLWEDHRYPGTLIVPDHLPAIGDPRLLRLLLQNLLENTVKYAKPGDDPDVSFTESGGVYCLRDRGIGMDPLYAEKVFEPFQRLHREQDIPGTGIGLSNVRRIAERHGGVAWIKSVPGEETRVFFTLGPVLAESPVNS
ncbi:PAS domain S-box protein [soil metagenome]